MSEFLVSNAVLISQIVLGLAIFIAVRTTLNFNRASDKSCPECGTPLPKSRIPTDLYELVIGGWTCSKCKTKLTHKLEKR